MKKLKASNIQNKNLKAICRQVALLCLISSVTLSMPAFASENQRAVSLEFEAIENASAYEVQIQRFLKNGKKKAPVNFKLDTPLWEATINYGKYELRLRSFDDRKVPGDWSEPMEFLVKPPSPEPLTPLPNQKILTKQANYYKVPFQWKPVSGATGYELKVTNLSNNESKIFNVNNSTKHVADLDVARAYAWKVLAILSDGVRGEEAKASSQFQLIGQPLEKPEVDEPVTKFVQKLTWDSPKHATSYNYAMYYKKKDGKWRRVEAKRGVKIPEAPFNLANPTGEYQIKVQALGDKREPSPLSTKIFPVEGNLRNPAAIEKARLKDSLNKPTNFYAIASYYITQMNYSSDRYETGQRSTFNALGGTGRLGAGYQNSTDLWGTYGVIDYGGINIDGENYTFASAELHGTWKFNLTQFSEFLGSAGVYMKELPEIQGNKTTGVTGVNKAQNIGPHMGFRYWLPLNYRLGLQINGRAYYSLLGSAPNGQEVQPALSYQLGVLGSMRLDKRFMGYAGYAYRVDQSSYLADPSTQFSNANAGDINLIQIQGHYLNLMLEYSF